MNQELSLVPELSVEDNIFLGGLDVPLLYRRRRLSEHARSVLDQLGLRHVQLGTPVETLSIGERQLVEIARLLVRDARLLILDEPTATLSKPEIERVFRATRDLVAQGRSVIFVSHRLDEVFELCDRVTVLRDGVRVGTHEIREIDRRSLIAHMLGEMEGAKTRGRARARAARDPAPRWSGSTGSTSPAASRRCRSRSRAGSSPVSPDRWGPARARSSARSAGSSRTPPARSRCNGEKVLLNTPRRAADAGVLYIPNDRQREGLFLGQTVERNLTVTRLRRLSRLGVLLRRRIQRSARELATMVGRPRRPPRLAGRQPQRRQPAEGPARPGAAARGHGAARPRRADPRRRRRRARRDPQPRPRSRAQGHGRDLLLDGARRGPRPRGRRRHDLRRPDRLGRPAGGGVGLGDPRGHDDAARAHERAEPAS